MYLRTLLSILFILLSEFIFPQNPPKITWQKCLGGTQNDIAYSVIQTKDGGYVVAGSSASSDGDILLKPANEQHGGNYDEWIVKLDAQSNIVWKRHTGGVGFDVAIKVVQTRDGGYIVGGNSSSFDVQGSYSNSDYWLNKLNSDGSIAWSKNYGGTGYDDFGSLDTTLDGGFILCGGASSKDGDVTGNIGSSDYWLVKTDGSGNIQWQKNYGGTDYDKAQAIKQTPDGGYIVVGFTSSNDGEVTGFHGVIDCWMVKLDASGTIQWQHCYGGSLDDYSSDVVVLKDGSYAFCGYTFSNNGDVSGNHSNDFDAWLMKVDHQGGILWQRCYGGTGTDYAESLDQTPDHGFIFGGFSKSTDGDCTANYGGQDFWLVKTDSAGAIAWQKNYGGTSNDVCNCVYAIPAGGYVATGYTASDDVDVSGNHTPYNYSDYWTLLLDVPTGIPSVNADTFKISVFPVPSQNFFTLQIENNYSLAGKSLQLQFYDLVGKKIWTGNFSSEEKLNIDCTNWNGGIYFYQMKHEDEMIASGKVIIQK